MAFVDGGGSTVTFANDFLFAPMIDDPWDTSYYWDSFYDYEWDWAEEFDLEQVLDDFTLDDISTYFDATWTFLDNSADSFDNWLVYYDLDERVCFFPLTADRWDSFYYDDYADDFYTGSWCSLYYDTGVETDIAECFTTDGVALLDQFDGFAEIDWCAGWVEGDATSAPKCYDYLQNEFIAGGGDPMFVEH